MEFNCIEFCIFGVPAYFFFAMIGLLSAAGFYLFLLLKKDYIPIKYMKAATISLIWMVIFARLTGIISSIYGTIGDNATINIDTILKSGIVFYGGLIGFLSSYYFQLRKINADEKDFKTFDLIAVCIPLFHTIARIGCFCAGCCYGVENECKIAVKYTTYVNGCINTAYRLPIQLFEAIFNFILFGLFLYLILRTDWQKFHLLYSYILIYGVGRFILEFFRGDKNRGLIGGVSFSQIISIASILFVIYKIIMDSKRYKEV